jgi:hypothetical protein
MGTLNPLELHKSASDNGKYNMNQVKSNIKSNQTKLKKINLDFGARLLFILNQNTYQ